MCLVLLEGMYDSNLCDSNNAVAHVVHTVQTTELYTERFTRCKYVCLLVSLS
jgi:hypothetical protein